MLTQRPSSAPHAERNACTSCATCRPCADFSVHRIGHVSELPDELWETVLTNRGAGLYGAKALRKIARVCRLFAAIARAHPDNITLLGSRVHPIVVVD